MKWGAAFVLGVALLTGSAQAAPHFPALTGRVVDDAHLLDAGAVQQLTQQSTDLEARTSDQLVVVTVPSLNGQSIEEYGVALGRHWGIGQKGKDNGVLLIVAPQEHKVRIEVGYGLEGTLTDAQSSRIIQTIILPAFKRGDMQAGILQGAQAIATLAGGGAIESATHYPASPSYQHTNGDHGSGATALFLILIGLFLFSQIVLFVVYVAGSILAFFLSLFGFNGLRAYLARMRTKILPADRALIFWLLMPSGRFTGSGGGSFGRGGGGFSGGGGSFGGGGGSGGW